MTEEAARLFRLKRNPTDALKVVHMYLSAWKFLPLRPLSMLDTDKVFDFLDFGALYGSRNPNIVLDPVDVLGEEGLSLPEPSALSTSVPSILRR